MGHKKGPFPCPGRISEPDLLRIAGKQSLGKSKMALSCDGCPAEYFVLVALPRKVETVLQASFARDAQPAL